MFTYHTTVSTKDGRQASYTSQSAGRMSAEFDAQRQAAAEHGGQWQDWKLVSCVLIRLADVTPQPKMR